jgi:hypothetical protein
MPGASVGFAGFFAANAVLNRLPAALLAQVTFDCLDALFDKAAAPTAEQYTSVCERSRILSNYTVMIPLFAHRLYIYIYIYIYMCVRVCIRVVICVCNLIVHVLLQLLAEQEASVRCPFSQLQSAINALSHIFRYIFLSVPWGQFVQLHL